MDASGLHLTAPAPDTDPGPGRSLRVSFIGSKCLLDEASGIAHSIRAILEALANDGAVATTFSASMFDGPCEVVLEDRIGHAGERIAVGRNGVVRITRSRVQHYVLRIASSRKSALTRAESNRMLKACKAYLSAKKPDIVITYGTGSHIRRLHDATRAAGAQLVFYLGNAEIEGSDWILPEDRAFSPSAFLASRYRKQLGRPVEVLHPIVSTDRIAQACENAASDQSASRQNRFITHVNAVPHKGLTLLIELARRAARERPAMQFLVLEGLMTREALRTSSVDLASFPNVQLLPVVNDMAAVYARTSILLMPSFWREGFGRTAVEANLSSVPVLASGHGGLPEALNGAGTLLEIPDICIDNPLAFPDSATVDRWWDALIELWDNPGVHAAASARARKAGQKYHPGRTTAAVRAYFQGIAASRTVRPDEFGTT